MKEIDLRSARERRRMNQSQLSERSGISQATISRLEAGQITNPELDTVKALARVLRVRADRIVFGQREERLAS